MVILRGSASLHVREEEFDRGDRADEGIIQLRVGGIDVALCATRCDMLKGEKKRVGGSVRLSLGEGFDLIEGELDRLE